MKVSVVVATHETPQESLDRLIASLDRQSMPADEFEVIFVDDGSLDDTVERLRLLASSRPNVRVESLANSGWPSKPRNHGTDLAGGEYVAYMDHDDELGPDALRGAYEFGIANHADVVAGKETFTNQANWALSTFTGDLGQSIGRTDTHPLLPMNPHKMYRRAFLNEHNIRFREGRRVLWEDILFNLQVAHHAKVISTLSTVPYYHWVKTKGSGTSLFKKWTYDYWRWLREVIEVAESELAGPHNELQRGQVVRHQYLGRVLRSFGPEFPRRSPEARQFIFDHAREMQEDLGLARFDDSLPAAYRSRAQLLRENNLRLMTELCEEEPRIAGEGSATSIRWENGVLRVHADVAWTDPQGRPHGIREGARIVRSYSEEVDDALSLELRDITNEVDSASIALVVRSRADRFTWLVPSDDEIAVTEAEDGSVGVSGRVVGTVDPATAAMGHPLSSGHWDIQLRAALGEEANTRPLRSSVEASVTVSDGRLHLAYPNQGGAATVFIDGAEEAVRRLRPAQPRLTPQGEIEIPLEGVHDGDGQVTTVVGIDRHVANRPQYAPHPATLEVKDGRALLRFRASDGQMRIRVGDRAAEGQPGLAVAVADRCLIQGELPVLPGSASQSPMTAGKTTPRKKKSNIRVLLITDRRSDDAGDQLVEGATVSLIKGVLKNLGISAGRFSITSRPAYIIPQGYLDSGDPNLVKSAREAISNADIIIFGNAPLVDHPNRISYRRTENIVELARDCGVPVLFPSIVVEAFDKLNPKSSKLALAIPVARQFTTRDDTSSVERHAEGASIVATRVSDPVLFADIVFNSVSAVPRPSSASVTHRVRRLVPAGAEDVVRRLVGRPVSSARSQSSEPALKRRIGLVVTKEGLIREDRVSFTAEKLREFWLDVISELKARGYDYRLFTTGYYADELFLDQVVADAGVPASKVAVTVNSPEELHAQLSACDGVIAYRLHASIAAFAYEIPTIGLSWNFKVPYFYESVGYGERALPVERWTAADVVPALEKAMAEGVVKDTDFLMTVYETLFSGIKGIVAPDSEAVPYTYEELRRELPRYPGTTEKEYREKVTRKLRRTYENYRRQAD